jgi:hypothetical protein
MRRAPQAAPTDSTKLEGEESGDTPEQRWQASLSNMAGDIISLDAYWKKEFGDWRKFEMPSDVQKLVSDALMAWSKIAFKPKVKRAA